LLFKHLKRRYSIFVVGHAGHGVSGQNGQQVFSLEDQIVHKIAFLDLLRTSNVQLFQWQSFQASNDPNDVKECEFVLMGHSIGAYIAFKVTKRRPDLRIRQIIALMPTIQNLWKGLSPIIKIGCLPLVREILAFALCFLPTGLILLIATLIFDSPLNQKLFNIIARKRDFHIIRNCLYMAYCEANEVTQLDDDCQDILKTHHNKLLLIFARKDPYVPISFVDQLQKRFPELANRIHFAEPHVSHAFVLQHSSEITQQILPLINLEK
jgi:pimeloyl-ACP methyl ester carboxylesterase